MKFTIGWLKEHLDTTASLNDIVLKLTEVGLEVEDVQDRGATYAPFRVVEVVEAVQHPNADRLRVCQVKTETGTIQVVCGAPNARAGMRAVYAPEGSVIPSNNMVLKKTKIRDVESNGMLVSEREMGLGEDHNGIIDLPTDTPIGTPMAEIFGLNDPLIEINVTPNRPDCAGIRGIARDLAAAGLGKLKPLSAVPVIGHFDSPIGVTLQFDAATKDACPLFLGRYIKGVKNGPSPAWLQQRLKAIGLRPISLLVDITNYFCIGLSRPLHVFDADKLKGNIHVRLASPGESFAALNGKSYDLTPSMTVVCDDSGVLGLGGIMGGESTGCTESTVNVYLECAYFDPLRTARAGRALQINSDARYRFERGIDPAFTVDAIEIATQMILDLGGGTPSKTVQAGAVPGWQHVISYSTALVKQMAGFEIDAAEQKKILTNLGFQVEDKGKTWNVTPPAWRPDVHGANDIVEEVLRINGYDKIPAVSMTKESAVTHAAETTAGSRIRQARTALASKGLQECITWAFMTQELADKFGANDNPHVQALRLTNPISTDLSQMRPSILPNLVQAAQRNADRGLHYAALFEVGPVFTGIDAAGQLNVAAGVRSVAFHDRHWSSKETNRAVDAYDAKSDVDTVVSALGFPADKMQTARGAPGWYHPGRSGVLKQGNVVIAHFGEIHPGLLDEMGIKGPVSAFEVFIDRLPESKRKGTAKPLLALSQFQPVSRDFAFVVGKDVQADDIVKAIKGADKDLITNIAVFDVYAGKGVEDGKKSVAVSVTLQPVEKTLTDEEIEATSKKIVDAVVKKSGAVLRG